MEQPRVEPGSVRVRFLRLNTFSLDVEVFAYFFASDWERFLEIQEGLLLRIMEIVAEAGSSIAFPSQTLHIASDNGAASNVKPTETRTSALRRALRSRLQTEQSARVFIGEDVDEPVGTLPDLAHALAPLQ